MRIAESHLKASPLRPQSHTKAWDYAPAGAGVPALAPGAAGRPAGGGLTSERKLRHRWRGNMPRAMMTHWLTMKIISHLNAASMKPQECRPMPRDRKSTRLNSSHLG